MTEKAKIILEDKQNTNKEDNQETIMDIADNIAKLSAEIRKFHPLTRKQKLFMDLEDILEKWEKELDTFKNYLESLLNLYDEREHISIDDYKYECDSLWEMEEMCEYDINELECKMSDIANNMTKYYGYEEDYRIKREKVKALMRELVDIIDREREDNEDRERLNESRDCFNRLGFLTAKLIHKLDRNSDIVDEVL